jgi:hypothetical protein
MQDVTRDLERIAVNPPIIPPATSSPRQTPPKTPPKTPSKVQPLEQDAFSPQQLLSSAVSKAAVSESSHYYSVHVDAKQLQQALGVHACSTLQSWLHTRWGLNWDIESAIAGSSSAPTAPHITLLFVDPEQTAGT